MNTLIQVAHNMKSNTLEAVWFDSEGKQKCRNFSPLQSEEFKEAAGEHAQKYIDLAGWTPEYIAAIAAEEQRLAKAAQDKADAEEAERRKAEKKRFDDAVAEQVAILEAAKKQVKDKQ